jgi:hypothetical protein
MSRFALAAVACAALAYGAAAQAAPAQGACGSLATVAAAWDAARFADPQKPMQAQVLGRGGRFASGPEIATMRRQIRAAEAACAAGDAAAAAPRIEAVRALLERQPGLSRE